LHIDQLYNLIAELEDKIQKIQDKTWGIGIQMAPANFDWSTVEGDEWAQFNMVGVMGYWMTKTASSFFDVNAGARSFK